MASGAEGLAGLSALSGGGGPAAQPARTPTATNSTENRFMIPCRDEFSKTELDFHWAEILDAHSTAFLGDVETQTETSESQH